MILHNIWQELIRPVSGIPDVLPPGTDREKLIEVFGTIVNRFLMRGRLSEHPALINVSGIPASGKSWYIRELMNTLPDFVYVSFDAIMEACEEYQQERLTDRESAFIRWEPVARVAGYDLLRRCVESRFPVIFEHSNADVRHLDLYRAVRAAGYRVEIRFIDAPPELVLPRLALRDRYFPAEQVILRWETINRLLPEYEKCADRFVRLEPWRGNNCSENTIQLKK